MRNYIHCLMKDKQPAVNQDSHYAVIEHSTNTPAAPPPPELEPVQYANVNTQ